jgi:hypothetical protein
MKFKIESKAGDYSNQYNATMVSSFLQELLTIRNQNLSHLGNYFIDNKLVSLDDGIKYANDLLDQKLAKKMETHKQIAIHIGATRLNNTKHKIWVKK